MTLSLVIADINYYLFLLFDLTFIVEYFQILIKRPVQLCTFKTIPVVVCFFQPCSFYLFTKLKKRTYILFVVFVFHLVWSIWFVQQVATASLKETTCSDKQKGKKLNSFSAYICFGICFQEVHHRFNWRGMSQGCGKFQQTQREND